jgi:ketosteroid isomerase-like protein
MTRTLGVALVVATCIHASAGPTSAAPVLARADSLDVAIRRMDDSMSAAFNAHDAPRLMALFTPDLEFYHDTQGLQRFQAVSDGFAALFAQNNGIRRERVGPLEVYPVRDYGAIEVGTHRFCHEERGRQDCGTFKFVQVWKRDGDRWRIARVVSYGH